MKKKNAPECEKNVKTDKNVISHVKCGEDRKIDNLDDTDMAVEKEFLAFIVKMKSNHPGHILAYQISNYPEGLECKFRLASLSAGQAISFASSFSQPEDNLYKQKQQLTDEQKKFAVKKEKLRRKRREAKKRKIQKMKTKNLVKCEECDESAKPAAAREDRKEG